MYCLHIKRFKECKDVIKPGYLFTGAVTEREKQAQLLDNMDIAKTVFRGAVKELGKEYQGKDDDNSDVFGVLVIDRFVDKSRYIGKSCKFNIDPDDSVCLIKNYLYLWS